MRPIDLPGMELRRHPRYVFSGTLNLVGSQGTGMIATDLSLSGVRFHSPRQLGVGQVIELVFHSFNVTVKGTVRHEIKREGKSWAIGVEFEIPQPEILKLAISAKAWND